tara:strand:- start:40997 stop:41173 length:177 start_codon:yes stop_codon:yes gene_type:complete
MQTQPVKTPFHADYLYKQGSIDTCGHIIDDFVANPPKTINDACKRIRTCQAQLEQAQR